MFESTFKNKKVLITGHSGFKGSWLSIWLNYLGANVFGLSLQILMNLFQELMQLEIYFICSYLRKLSLFLLKFRSFKVQSGELFKCK